jgi:hypothetical protein
MQPFEQNTGLSAFVPGMEAPACCKICTVGKACGNSCISRNYTCRQPPGCACDARP